MTPNELILQYRPMALSIARQYKGTSVDLEDLRGIACLALVEAAHSWPNPEAEKRGITFAAHAATRIKWALNNAIWANSPVTIHRRGWVKVKALRKARKRKIEEANGEYPTAEELAAELGWPVKKVRDTLLVMESLQVYSLDKVIPGGDGEDTFAAKIPDPSNLEEETLERLIVEEERPWLIPAVDKLPQLMRTAVSLRFGLPVPKAKSLTVEDVLAVFNNVSNVNKGLGRLREVRRDECGDMPDVVPDSRGLSLGGRKAGEKTEVRQRWNNAEDLWRRIIREQPPPAVQGERAGAVRPGE